MEPYTYSPHEEDPAIEPRPIWKSWRIVLGVVLAIVLLIVGIVFLVRVFTDSEAEEQTERVVQQARVVVERCPHEGCKRAEVLAHARESGVVQVCELLEGEERDNCIWSVALNKQDERLCKEIGNASWADGCRDSVRYALALRAGDVNACNSITDEQSRSACTATLLGPVTSTNCSARGYDEVYCSALNTSDRARLARDPDICEEISSEEIKGECLERVGVADRDGDGLSEEQEAEYGSDDRKTDTDGDGFSDGEEVSAGYNPSGPGRL